jgi:hypothetical protein
VWICGTRLRIRHGKADGELVVQGSEWLWVPIACAQSTTMSRGKAQRGSGMWFTDEKREALGLENKGVGGNKLFNGGS